MITHFLHKASYACNELFFNKVSVFSRGVQKYQLLHCYSIAASFLPWWLSAIRKGKQRRKRKDGDGRERERERERERRKWSGKRKTGEKREIRTRVVWNFPANEKKISSKRNVFSAPVEMSKYLRGNYSRPTSEKESTHYHKLFFPWKQRELPKLALVTGYVLVCRVEGGDDTINLPMNEKG